MMMMAAVPEESSTARKPAGEDDLGDGTHCSAHPYTSNPGGICAFCLQDKLGKLLTSSSSSKFSPSTSFFPAAVAPGSSSSSPPPFRSAPGGNGRSELPFHQPQSSHLRRARLPFGILTQKKKKKEMGSEHHNRKSVAGLSRSKSTATPRFLEDDGDFSPQKRSGKFWSFLYLSKPSSSTRYKDPNPKNPNIGLNPNLSRRNESADDSESPNASSSSSSFGRKVSRSRSVGCGSRSFSGDFFERISTGLGDCTLRRVESQREGKPKPRAAASGACDRVRCGGIFSGFILTSSSSSSSYLVPGPGHEEVNGRSTPAVAAGGHGRSKSWGRALASPMRAFASKPSPKKGAKRETGIAESSNRRTNANATPNLAAIPSLLAART